MRSMSSVFSSFVAAFNGWLFAEGWKIVVILVGGWLVHTISLAVVDRSVRRLIIRDKGMTAEDERKREDTLIRIMHSTLHVLLIGVIAVMIISTLGIAVGPILAAAGIAGLAFGFGGQYLIRDVITGLFIILENQYRVDDVVRLNGTSGVVEDVTLRVTTLRDLDGVVHHIPNGEITHVANMGKRFARVNLDIGVSYEADLEEVERVVNQVGRELADDPDLGPSLMMPPKFLRVEQFADSAVVIKILGDVRPLKQWDVAGALRKRLKIAFDKAGIEIPFPQRVIHQADDRTASQ